MVMHTDICLEANGYLICASATENTGIVLVPFLEPCYKEVTYSQRFTLSLHFEVLNFVCFPLLGVYLYTVPTDRLQLEVYIHFNPYQSVYNFLLKAFFSSATYAGLG
jgi:hypothetical protein